MGLIWCCRDCKPPKRNPYCHTNCPEYLAEKAAHEERKKEADRKKFVSYELNAQRGNGVYIATKKRKVN